MPERWKAQLRSLDRLGPSTDLWDAVQRKAATMPKAKRRTALPLLSAVLSICIAIGIVSYLGFRLLPSWGQGQGSGPSPRTSAQLAGVAADRYGHVWSAGGIVRKSGNSEPLLMRWTDGRWSTVSTPSPGQESNVITALSAISANDVWVVGYYQDPGSRKALVEAWDGRNWTVVPLPSISTSQIELYGIAARSRDDVWVSGASRDSGPLRTLVAHWDGGQWTTGEVPNPGSGNNILGGLAAISATDVWAVGWYQTEPGGPSTALIEHWNGTNWGLVSSHGLGADSILYSVSAVSPTDVWAVGSHGRGSDTTGLVAHWNGINWSRVPTPNPGTNGNILQAVDSVGPSNVWAVGSYTNGRGNRTLIEHWDGKVWQIVPSADPGSLNDALAGVAAVSSEDIWAVGSSQYSANGGDQPLIERWDGSSWRVVPVAA